MKYQVVWEADAIDALQGIYNAAYDQEGVLNTVTRIGMELSSNPHEAGESRDVGERVLFKFPLLVFFRISEPLKQVAVYKVRPIRP